MKTKKNNKLANKARLLIKRDKALNVPSSVVAKSMLLTGMFGIACLSTSCSTSFDAFGNSDLQMSGNEHGYNAFFDGLSQAMINAKAKENIPTDTPDHEARRIREKQRTIRQLGYPKPMSLKPKKIGGNNGR